MDKYVSKRGTKTANQVNRQIPLAEQSSSTMHRTKQAKDKSDKQFTKTGSGKNKSQTDSMDCTSDALSGEETPFTGNSPHSSPRPEPEPSALQATLVAQEVSKMLMPLFDKRLEILHTSINSALTQITNNTQRIGELETRVQETEQSVTNMSTSIQQLQSLETELRNKIEDLENRHRRNNLRFVGIPERIGNDQLMDYLTKEIPKALHLDLPEEPTMIERAHRLGPPRNNPNAGNDRPRPVIAKYLHWAVKEKILRAFRQNRDIQIGGNKILIFQDFSALVTQKRKAFAPVCQVLAQRNIRFQLIYPARLKMWDGPRPTMFETPPEAKRHLRINDEGD